MSKKAILKKDFVENQSFSSIGKKSEELKETKLMQKELSKNDDMFFEKNTEVLKKDINKKVNSFSSEINGIFSIFETVNENLQKTATTSSFKLAATTISDGAYSFFIKSKELLDAIENIYVQNKELLNDKELKKLEDMIKSLSLIVSMSTAFYKISKNMIAKIDLDVEDYTTFEENLSLLLDICKTVQSRISSNLASYKIERLKVEFINDEKQNIFFEYVKQIDLLKTTYKSSNRDFYQSLKSISTTIRDEKRKNDKELNKKIVKVNI